MDTKSLKASRFNFHPIEWLFLLIVIFPQIETSIGL